MNLFISLENLFHRWLNLYLALNRWNILVGEIFDIFSLIKQKDEKSSHQSDWTWHWQGPSDWMFNYWQWLMTHHRQNHPWVNSSSDETPAELWVYMDRNTISNLNLYLNIFMKNDLSHVVNEHTYAAPADTHTVENMCTKLHRHRPTAAYPYRSFHFSSKGRLKIPKLNCSLHSHLSTAARKISNAVQYKYFSTIWFMVPKWWHQHELFESVIFEEYKGIVCVCWHAGMRND